MSRCDSPSAAVTIEPSFLIRDLDFGEEVVVEDVVFEWDRNWLCFCIILDAIMVDERVVDARCNRLIDSPLRLLLLELLLVFIIDSSSVITYDAWSDGKWGNIDDDGDDVERSKSSFEDVGDVDKDVDNCSLVKVAVGDDGGGKIEEDSKLVMLLLLLLVSVIILFGWELLVQINCMLLILNTPWLVMLKLWCIDEWIAIFLSFLNFIKKPFQ